MINWADQNAYYCKMMFENIAGWGSLYSVKACIDGTKCAELQRFAGATWTGCPQGKGSSITFTLRQRSPSGQSAEVLCACASPVWPWPTGSRCTCPTNFAGKGGSSPGSTGTGKRAVAPALSSNGKCPAKDPSVCTCDWAKASTCGMDDLSKCWCPCCCPLGKACQGHSASNSSRKQVESSNDVTRPLTSVAVVVLAGAAGVAALGR